MFLKCILLSLVLSLCTAITVRKGGGIGRTTTFLCRNGGTDWTISNGGSPYRTNIQERSDVLEINSIVAQHEGNYTCNSETSQLIVLGVVKFQGEHCSPYQHCDLGVTSTLPEGQPIPLNISFDFVNGGPRGEKQTIEFIRFKQSGSVLLSCSSGGCSYASNVDKSPDSNVNNIQANVTDDRPINPSRVFVAELDISRDSNFYETRTATFTVNVKGYCSRESIDSNRGTFVWPETDLRMTAVVACPYGPNGVTVSRACTSNDFWESPNVTRCLTAISSRFKNISKVPLTMENNIAVLMSLNELVANSTDSNDQSIDNIIIVSNILNQTAILISDHATLSTSNLTIITENVIQILNNIEEWSTIMRAEGNQIIQSFERIVDALLNHSIGTNVDIVERKIAFAIRKIGRSSFDELTFTATVSNDSLMIDTDGNSTDTEIGSITLPKSILNVTTDATIKLAFSLYEETAFIPIRDPPPNTIVGSSVISARIAGVPDGTQLLDPVVINLALKINNFSNLYCVYWDFNAVEGGGNWSTDGCTVEAANSSVTCHCNHLTNFAILVDISSRTEGPTQSPHHIAITLNLVSYVGAGVSLVGLILTIITHVIFKKIRTKDASKFHIQLCVSLSLMLIVFVSDISEVSPKEGCISVGVLIHYFALVAWMWMGAEALLMFHKLQIVFVNVAWCYHLAVSIVCWGVPLIPVTILLAVDYNYYLTLDGNGSGYCFIGELIPFLAAFLCPIFVILLFNIIVYILIIRVLVLHTARKIERKKISLTTTDAVKMVASFISILILFGLTWALAIFTSITEPSVSYIIKFFFCFFNAFQGFFIFLFFIVFNSESRNAWKSLFCKQPVSKKKNQSTVTQARQKILLSSQTKTNNTSIELSCVARNLAETWK